jgi:hypothetical protein
MPGEIHRKVVHCICGQDGRAEFPLRDGRKLDCWKPNTCAEVELSKGRITKALSRLEAAKAEGLCNTQVLLVKEKDIDFAQRLAEPRGVRVRSVSQACDVTTESKTKESRGGGLLLLGLILVGVAALVVCQKR